LSDPNAIRFERVVKTYRTGETDRSGLKHALLHLPQVLRERRNRSTFTALDGVSFDVRRGECFGIIGKNGSGKSTTLGLMAGVLRPTSGAIRVDGRVSPLLELGAGFHPELSGQENLLLNGVLLGLTRREVLSKREAIVAFSELGDFIHRPLRTYSSGMIARLGFSVVVHLSPEILLIDEVLAVGDEGFQGKCMRKMAEFRVSGTTMVFVSHNLAAVESICDRVALLEAGRLAALGPPKDVIAEYVHRVRAAEPPGAAPGQASY
jgi:lipopolysaccharide transport system ATP-binding protein